MVKALRANLALSESETKLKDPPSGGNLSEVLPLWKRKLLLSITMRNGLIPRQALLKQSNNQPIKQSIKVIEKRKPRKQSHTSLRARSTRGCPMGAILSCTLLQIFLPPCDLTSACNGSCFPGAFPTSKNGNVKIKFQALDFVLTVGSRGT